MFQGCVQLYLDSLFLQYITNIFYTRIENLLYKEARFSSSASLDSTSTRDISRYPKKANGNLAERLPFPERK
jgi:hypothetical protein